MRHWDVGVNNCWVDESRFGLGSCKREVGRARKSEVVERSALCRLGTQGFVVDGPMKSSEVKRKTASSSAADEVRGLSMKKLSSPHRQAGHRLSSIPSLRSQGQFHTTRPTTASPISQHRKLRRVVVEMPLYKSVETAKKLKFYNNSDFLCDSASAHPGANSNFSNDNTCLLDAFTLS